MSDDVILLTDDRYTTADAKVAHGLVRGSERFRVVAVLDTTCAGADAGTLLDGRARGIPVHAGIAEALAALPAMPAAAVIGVATHGGRLSAGLRAQVLDAVTQGLSVVNGLHEFLGDDTALREAAAQRGVTLTDVRRPPATRDLHFWHGDICKVRAPRIAVLGTDCALGKRTTTRLLVEALVKAGIAAQMIYTGQTGWMQGARHGLVLDSLPNDFVCGEIERALVACDRECSPDVMVIEGQSALRNPSGPCGAEFLLAGQTRAVVLQHAVGREFFEDYEHLGLRIPEPADEIDLISRYGARTLAVTLNGRDCAPERLRAEQRRLGTELGIPVVCPLEDGVAELVPVLRGFIDGERRT